MKCVHCGRVDGDHIDKPLQCTCYTWFMYTCAVCFATLLIGLTCCIYCTYMLVSLNKTVTNCAGSFPKERSVQEESSYTDEISFQEKGTWQGGRSFSKESLFKEEPPFIERRLLKEKMFHDVTADQKIKTAAMHFENINKLRRKRNDRQATKKKKRKGKSKKKQKVQAAHYVLRGGLQDPGNNCPPGSNNRMHTGVMKRTLDIFQLATFINANSNPFTATDGKFYAKKKGLYLVYAQILFEDCRAEETMKIVQNRKVGNTEVTIQEHYCFVGVPKTDKSYNNTCSLTALFFLERKDYLTVMNYYPEVHISYRSSNSSFFGAVYLR